MKNKSKINTVELISQKDIADGRNETDGRKTRLSLNFANSAERFNAEFEKFPGKTIIYKRVNQALAVYDYAGCDYPKGMPMFWCAIIEYGRICFRSCYRNIDKWEIK